MTIERRIALRRDLDELIVSELHDSSDRLRWLTQRLEMFVVRWIGFCSNTTLALSSLINTDLHFVVVVAAEMVNEVLARHPANQISMTAWHRFVRLMQTIDDQSGPEIAVDVSRTFEMAKRELMTIGRDA